MKKIITLMLVAGLVSTAAFAQDHRHSYDNTYNYNANSYSNQYPRYKGYSSYGNDWSGRTYYDPLAYRRHRELERRMMYRRYLRNHDAYRTRSGVSLQLVIGNRRRY